MDIGVVGIAFWCVAGLAVLACIASFWVREGSNGKEIVLEDENEDDGEEQEAEQVQPPPSQSRP